MNVDILIERFRQHFGHADFTHEQLLLNEHAYKAKSGQDMRERLGPETPQQLVADGN